MLDTWWDFGEVPNLRLGEGQLQFETHECQVCWTDSTCEDLGSMGMSVHPETVPSTLHVGGSVVLVACLLT